MTRPACKGDVLTHVRPVGDDMAVSGGGDVAVVAQEGGREVKTRVHAACEPTVSLRWIGKGGGHLRGGEGKRLRGDLGRHRVAVNVVGGVVRAVEVADPQLAARVVSTPRHELISVVVAAEGGWARPVHATVCRLADDDVGDRLGRGWGAWGRGGSVAHVRP